MHNRSPCWPSPFAQQSASSSHSGSWPDGRTWIRNKFSMEGQGKDHTVWKGGKQWSNLVKQGVIDNPTQGKACKAHLQSRTTWCHCKAIVIPTHGHGHRAAMLHFSYTCACCRRGLHDELPLGLGHNAFLHGLANWVGACSNTSCCLRVCWFGFIPHSLFHSRVPSLWFSLLLPLSLPL